MAINVSVHPMLLPSGNPFKCHEEVLYFQLLIPPKRFDIFFPLTGGCSEGLGAFRFFFKPFILDVRLVDAPAGVTQEESHTGFLHLPSAVLALIFLARRILPSLSLVDRDVKFCVPTK